MPLRRLLFRRVHAQLGGLVPALRLAPARSSRPRCSRRGRTWASPSSRATARPRPVRARPRRSRTTGWAPSGGRPEGIEMRLRRGRRGPVPRPVPVQGLLERARRRPPRPTRDDGWYMTGDVGHFDKAGRLILSGRSRDMIVLPNGFNVYPEDIENALRIAGLRTRSCSRRSPGGSRRSSSRRRLRRSGTAGEQLDFDPASPPTELRATHRCRGQGGERLARREPAHLRLAPLARLGLPADPHPQGQARPRPRLGDRRRRVGRRLGRNRYPAPDPEQRVFDLRGVVVGRDLRRPGEEDDRGTDDPEDEPRRRRVLNAPRSAARRTPRDPSRRRLPRWATRTRR